MKTIPSRRQKMDRTEEKRQSVIAVILTFIKLSK